MPKKWKGKGSHCREHGTEIVEKDFSFELIEYEIGQGNAVQDGYQLSGKINGYGTGVLIYDGKRYMVEGKIFTPEKVGGNYYIDMSNVEKKIGLEGDINVDGKMNVTVDTAYKPNAILYRPVDRYAVNMFVAE